MTLIVHDTFVGTDNTVNGTRTPDTVGSNGWDENSGSWQYGWEIHNNRIRPSNDYSVDWVKTSPTSVRFEVRATMYWVTTQANSVGVCARGTGSNTNTNWVIGFYVGGTYDTWYLYDGGSSDGSWAMTEPSATDSHTVSLAFHDDAVGNLIVDGVTRITATALTAPGSTVGYAGVYFYHGSAGSPSDIVGQHIDEFWVLDEPESLALHYPAYLDRFSQANTALSGDWQTANRAISGDGTPVVDTTNNRAESSSGAASALWDGQPTSADCYVGGQVVNISATAGNEHSLFLHWDYNGGSENGWELRILNPSPYTWAIYEWLNGTATSRATGAQQVTAADDVIFSYEGGLLTGWYRNTDTNGYSGQLARVVEYFVPNDPGDEVQDSFTGTGALGSLWESSAITTSSTTLATQGGGSIINGDDTGTDSAYTTAAASPSSADCYAWGTMAGTANYQGIYIRGQQGGGAGTQDGYFLEFDNDTDNLYIKEVTNGSSTTKHTASVPALTTGDRIGITCDGSKITSWYDEGSGWVEAGSVIDTTHTAPGWVGAWLYTTDEFSEMGWGNLTNAHAPRSSSPNDTVLDTFTGSDGDPLNATNWDAGAWSNQSAPQLDGSGNAEDADASGSSQAYWKSLPASADQSCWVEAATADVNIAALVRMVENASNDHDGYEVYYEASNNTIRIARFDGWPSGSFTDIGTTYSHTLAVGDRIGATISGSTIRAWLDTGSGWVEVLRVKDTTYRANGMIGFLVPTTQKVAEFGGGVLAVGDIGFGIDNTTSAWGSFSGGPGLESSDKPGENVLDDFAGASGDVNVEPRGFVDAYADLTSVYTETGCTIGDRTGGGIEWTIGGGGDTEDSAHGRFVGGVASHTAGCIAYKNFKIVSYPSDVATNNRLYIGSVGSTVSGYWNDGVRIALRHTASGPVCFIQTDASNSGVLESGSSTAQGTTVLSTGTTYNIDVVYTQNDEVRLYLNGVSECAITSLTGGTGSIIGTRPGTNMADGTWTDDLSCEFEEATFQPYAAIVYGTGDRLPDKTTWTGLVSSGHNEIPERDGTGAAIATTSTNEASAYWDTALLTGTDSYAWIETKGTASSLGSDYLRVWTGILSEGTANVDAYEAEMNGTADNIRLELYENAAGSIIGVSYIDWPIDDTAATSTWDGTRLAVSRKGTSIRMWLDLGDGIWRWMDADKNDTYTSNGKVGFLIRGDNVKVSRFGGGMTPALSVLNPTVKGTGVVNVASTGTTVVPVIPTHAVDDILVCEAAHNSGSNLTINGSWADIVSPNNNANLSTAWWWLRAATTSEPNPTVTSSVTNTVDAALFARVIVIQDAATSGTPFEDATILGATTSATVSTSEVTTTGDNRYVIGFSIVDDDTSWSTSPPPAAWTLLDDDTAEG
jgi:hypothetical protein